MKRVTMSKLKSMRHLPSMQYGITVVVLRIQGPNGPDDFQCIAGIRDGEGTPVGIISLADSPVRKTPTQWGKKALSKTASKNQPPEEGGAIRYWTRETFITTTIQKLFGMAYGHTISIPSLSNTPGLFEYFVEEFELHRPDANP